jgi:hypothetical protein
MHIAGPLGPLAQAAIWERLRQGPSAGAPAGGTAAGGAAAGGAPATGVADAAAARTVASSPFGKGKSVLVLGDSHTEAGAFGAQLTQRISDNGAKVSVDAKSGKSPTYFFGRVEKLVKEHKPDTIVIALGTNYREDGDGKTQGMVDAQVKGLVKRLRAAGSTAEIVWVGPPSLRQDGADGGAALRTFDARMKKALGNEGRYIPSSELTRYEGRDGVHYTQVAARHWADKVFEAAR